MQAKKTFASALSSILSEPYEKNSDQKDEEEHSAKVVPILSECKRLKREEERLYKQIRNEKKRKEFVRKRKLLSNDRHVLPSVNDREMERKLRKLATKGVVQLFNAINKQQKSVKPVEFTTQQSAKLEKMSRRKFLQLLKTKKERPNEETTQPIHE